MVEEAPQGGVTSDFGSPGSGGDTLTTPRRYYVRGPDGTAIAGHDDLASAQHAAVAMGDGTHLIDTMGQAYYPMVQEAAGGGEIVYSGSAAGAAAATASMTI